jgi:methyltransferase-like protein
MNKQQNIIQRYRQLFPQETLRETSIRTNIQITRVFRLFNGKPMKVKEFEVFETIIKNKVAEKPEMARLSSLMEEAFAILSQYELNKIYEYVARRNYLKKNEFLCSPYNHQELKQA